MANVIEWVKAKRANWIRRFADATKRLLVLLQYQYMNTIDAQDKQVLLMNYGWIDPETQEPLMTLKPEDELNRCSLQLYHRVAAAVDLHDKDVLEVGCGRGGGAAYVATYLGPRTMHGVDLCPSSITFCTEHYAIPCLTFSKGNAEALKQPRESMDAVINVESSHCYVYFDQFVHSVYRVLRPGGYLLYADFRPGGQIDDLRTQLLAPGFELVDEEDLNPGIMLALDAEDARKHVFIEQKVSKRRKAMFEMFAAVKGSPIYRAFACGDAKYVRFVLRKPDTATPQSV